MPVYPTSTSDRMEPLDYGFDDESLCDDCGFALDVTVDGVLHMVCVAEYVLNGCLKGTDVSDDIVTSCEYRDQCRRVAR